MKNYISALFSNTQITKQPSFLSAESLVLFFCSLIIFTLGLFNHEFVQFEARFGLFSQEMLRNGLSFFPTTYNKYYPDYPATYTIITYYLSHLAGKLTIWVAVFPTAITSALTIVLTFLTGSLRSPKWGLYAAILSFLTFNFLSEARTISLDQFTTTATIFCFYCCYSGQMLEKPRRLWLIPIGLIYGFIFRGPIGMVIPASIVASFFMLEKQYKKLIYFSCLSLILFVACIGCLLFAALYSGGIDFVHDVIRMEALGRIDSSGSVPFYYYFLTSFAYYAISYPLALLILFTYPKKICFPHGDNNFIFLRHLIAWMLIVLIGLSIPSDEKARYILPITPALTLITAYFFTETTNKLLQQIRQIIIKLFLLLPLLGLGAILVCNFYAKIKGFQFHTSYLFAYLLFGIQLLLLFFIRKKELSAEINQFYSICIAALAFVTIYVFLIQPIDVYFNTAIPFVTQVEQNRAPNKLLIFYRIGPDGEDIKYMVALDKPLQPQFAKDTQAIIGIKNPAIFIAKTADFYALPPQIKGQFTVLFTGRLGHQVCVVFTNQGK